MRNICRNDCGMQYFSIYWVNVKICFYFWNKTSISFYKCQSFTKKGTNCFGVIVSCLNFCLSWEKGLDLTSLHISKNMCAKPLKRGNALDEFRVRGHSVTVLVSNDPHQPKMSFLNATLQFCWRQLSDLLVTLNEFRNNDLKKWPLRGLEVTSKVAGKSLGQNRLKTAFDSKNSRKLA